MSLADGYIEIPSDVKPSTRSHLREAVLAVPYRPRILATISGLIVVTL